MSLTALLLVDSDCCTIQEISDPQPRYHLTEFTKRRDLTRVFQHGRTFDSTTSRNKQPIFDMFLDGHDQRHFTDESDLHVAIAFIRNIIRSIWEEEIMGLAKQVTEIREEDETMHRSGQSLKPTLTMTRAPEYEEYRALMRYRLTIQEHKAHLRHIMWFFRCRRPKKILDSAEHESWAILDEKLDAADTTLGDHMAMFAQRSALIQADAAERQARSSGQLTKIATFIVPGTFVASIFSMGGDFAAGGRLFFVYWALSIPITILLLIWVMINNPDRKNYVQDFKKQLAYRLREKQKQSENKAREAKKQLRRRKEEHQEAEV